MAKGAKKHGYPEFFRPPKKASVKMSKRAPSLVDLAHRTAVTGLVGLGIWGLWLTAAVWKSRRDERLMIAANNGQIPISQQGLALSQQQNGEDPFPVTNDPKHEPGRRV